MANILLLGAGTQALAILQSLHKAEHRIVLIVDSVGNYADESRYVSRRIVCQSSPESEEYLQVVLQLVNEEQIDVVIPMGDKTAEFVSRRKSELSKHTHVIAPDYDNFKKGYDKNQLMRHCRERHLPHPQTVDMSATTDVELREFHYPALLKPNCTTGGRGMVMACDYEGLMKVYPIIHADYGECHLQRFIREGGRQVKIQLCVDENGTLLQHSVLHKVRWYPIKGGASCCAVSIKDERIVSICHQILKDIHWIGFADFDTIEDPDTGELLIMEINPRLPACIGAAVYAGIDWGNVLVNQALEIPQHNYVYKEGVAFRHLGFDVLWFLKSQDRFKTKPSWFMFLGRKVYYQDFHFWDQKPFWFGTYHNIKKLFDPDFKKAKSGSSSI